MNNSYANEGVIFTFLKVGNSMKVTATDIQSGVEAIMQTPLSLSKNHMKILAIQKLTYIINKQVK